MGKLEFGVWDQMQTYEVFHAKSAADVYDKHIEQFKQKRLDYKRKEYERFGKEVDEFRMKRGVNKDLENIRTVLRAGADKNFISDHMILQNNSLQFQL